MLASLAVTLLCAGAHLVSPVSVGAAEPPESSSLAVKVSGLPASAEAAVTVSGPDGFEIELERSRTLTGLSPGKYRVRVGRVDLERSAKGIPAGSDAFPADPVVSVRLRPDRRAVAPAPYGTIRSDRVVVLAAPVKEVVGAAFDPTAIVLSSAGAKRIGAGAILTAAPSPVLPGGLLHRVTGIDDRGGRATLALDPSPLSKAFPALDVTDSVLLRAPAPSGSATASGALSAIDLSFGRELIEKKLKASCGLSPGGWRFSPTASVRPTLKVDIHRRYLVVPYGDISLKVKGSLGIEATVPAGIHCGFTIDGPSIQGVIPVAGVPVPVVGGVDLVVELQNNEAIEVKAKAALEMTGGMSFDGPKVKPVFNADPSGSGSVSGLNGALEVGPKLHVGIGVITGNAHVDVTPRLVGEVKNSRCEILLRASVGAGLDLGSFRPSVDSPNRDKSIFRCPDRKDGAGGGAAKPERGGSTGTWTLQSAPTPTGAQFSILHGVSCASPSFCMAVGRTDAGNGALAEIWNGSGWTIVPAASGPGSETNALYDVDCVSASFCVAVGSTSVGG